MGYAYALTTKTQNTNLSWTPSNVFCGYRQTDSKGYMERQKIQNSQRHIEGQDQTD